ncbi:hypothetical protein LOY67_24390 [Pseudomonas sp. B21-056]|jgi:hypothetical protein|uniref:hypothetical protein n=1 Tax=Pseudomonas sp. B21-056 TaxID=2895495 RepID=UPI00223165EF|nr:hypothetical protein [Pseudomonas sp. B21-056]UZE23109.1 hypothetical protein LOY67_24390 [Pseudomonas sp. B21-056]
MNNLKQVKVLAIDELIEESVTLLICGESVECFANYCPNLIQVGEMHTVELSIDYSETYQVRENPKTNVCIEKANEGFSYFFYGFLNGEVFETFTDLPDEGIHFDYPELNGKFVKIKVDRVNVSFM